MADPTIIVTAAELFTDSDPDHPFAEITRVGGQPGDTVDGETAYQIRRFDGVLLTVGGDEVRPKTYESAIKHAADWARTLEQGSGELVGTVRQLRAELVTAHAEHVTELASRDAEITRIVDEANGKLRTLRDQVATLAAQVDKLSGKPPAPTVSAPAAAEASDG